MRKYRNARKQGDQPALVWNRYLAMYHPNRAARRSASSWGWRHAAVNATLAEHADAVSYLLTGKRSLDG